MDAHRHRVRTRTVETGRSMIIGLILLLASALISGCFIPQKQFTD